MDVAIHGKGKTVMVCRENKCRSALMGYEKHMLRQMGLTNYHDHEVQSGIHAAGHLYASADDPSREEQMALIRGLRQQIIHDPTIPDDAKYRVSDKQPGLVTRLDQELRRMETGLDERGMPLRPEQLNSGKHYATIKRLGPLLQRGMQAKGAYLETYARGMGVTYEEAERRWDELVTRPVEKREDTKVRLTDDWQEQLAVSGLTSVQQADIGQSNEARYALRYMEAERQAHLRSLPHEPTLSPAQEVHFAKTDSPQAQLRCGLCGQFGHDDYTGKCPNENLVHESWEANDRSELATDAYEDAHSARRAQLMLQNGPDAVNPDGSVVYHKVGDNSQRMEMTFADYEEARKALEPTATTMPPLSYTQVLAAKGSSEEADLARVYNAQQMLAQAKNGGVGHFFNARKAADRFEQTGSFGPITVAQPVAAGDSVMVFSSQQSAKDLLSAAADGAPTDDNLQELRRRHEQCEREAIAATRALEAAAAQKPRVSDAVAALNYDRATGLLEVTSHPYMRKSTGEVMPAKKYRYRVPADVYERIIASPSVGEAINNTVWARGQKGWPYKWENEAEAAAAGVRVRCPTCGQYAAMTSSHQCPVRGGFAEKQEAAWRERMRVQREKERLEHLRPRIAATARRREVRAETQGQINGGFMRFPERRAMIAARDDGTVALGAFQGQYLDAHVTGKVYTWREPGTGTPLLSAAAVKCSRCGAPPCRHTGKLLDQMATTYGATRVANVTPGSRAFLKDAAIAQDAPTAPIDRLPLAEIRARRRRNRDRIVDVESSNTHWRVFGSLPIDAATKVPVAPPKGWTGPDGERVEFTAGRQAAAVKIEQALVARGMPPVVMIPHGDGSHTLRTVHAPAGRMSMKRRQQLQELLGLSHVDAGGVHVPADTGWVYEFLDRSHGRAPRLLGSRVAPRTGEHLLTEV